MNRKLLTLGALVVAGLFLSGGSGCRKDSEAFRTADLGRALAERGENDLAIAKLKEALSMDPGLVMAHEVLAGVYQATGRLPEAVAEYRETVRLDPVRDDAHARLGCLLLTTEGATAEAEDQLVQATQLNRAHAGAWACLAAIHLDRQAFDDAIREARKAVELDHESVQGHLTLGIALAESGDKDAAVPEIERAIEYAGDDEDTVSQARMYLQSISHPDVPGGPG